jgi:hypothetical protein
MYMKRRGPRNPVAIALYVNAAILLVILGVLLGRDSTPMLTPAALAQAVQGGAGQPALSGGAGVFIAPAQFSTTVWGVYLLDVDQQTICAYSISGNPPQLRLTAARNFRYDRRLGNYNIAGPSALEVKELLEKEQADTRTGEAPTTK